MLVYLSCCKDLERIQFEFLCFLIVFAPRSFIFIHEIESKILFISIAFDTRWSVVSLLGKKYQNTHK